MLRQICRRARLTAYIQSPTNLPTALRSALRLLVPLPATDQEITCQTRAVRLQDGEYNKILAYLNSPNVLSPGTSPFRHHHAYPHPINPTAVLSSLMTPVHNITWKTRDYTTFTHHPGNSLISFRFGQEWKLGRITSMQSQIIADVSRTFISVAHFKPLDPSDVPKNPYLLWTGFKCTLMYSELSGESTIIEDIHIRGHVAYLARPPGTFGIKQGTTIFNDSLHRNRE